MYVKWVSKNNLYSARVTCRLEVNRKHCGDGAQLSYVVYVGCVITTADFHKSHTKQFDSLLNSSD